MKCRINPFHLFLVILLLLGTFSVSHAATLVDTTVTVDSGGGSAQVQFSADAGDIINVTYTGDTDMCPYGYISYPDGSGEYFPTNASCGNSTNGQVVLSQTGTHSLTVFDGHNMGGTVAVLVETTNEGDCVVDFVGMSVTGSLVPGGTVTITADAANTCGHQTIYYRYSFHPDYGTDDYTGLNWQMMTQTEWVTDDQISHVFPNTGKYVVVIWATAFPDVVDSASVPIIGQSVYIREGGPTLTETSN